MNTELLEMFVYVLVLALAMSMYISWFRGKKNKLNQEREKKLDNMYLKWEWHLFSYLDNLSDEEFVRMKIYNKNAYAVERFTSFMGMLYNKGLLTEDLFEKYEEIFNERLKHDGWNRGKRNGLSGIA